MEETENKYSNIDKELAESQVSNKEYKKQIEKLQADLEKQLKSTQQFQVCMDVRLENKAYWMISFRWNAIIWKNIVKNWKYIRPQNWKIKSIS